MVVRHVLERHGVERPDLPGTGGSSRATCSTQLGCTASRSSSPATGTIMIRKSLPCGSCRSITMGARSRRSPSRRMKCRMPCSTQRRARVRHPLDLVRKLVWVDRIASGLLLLAPVILILVRGAFPFRPANRRWSCAADSRIAVHVVTLPVELDASFGKALPVLERGRYLSAADMPAARTVLRAAAFTYVASALMTLLNIARWFRILRF